MKKYFEWIFVTYSSFKANYIMEGVGKADIESVSFVLGSSCTGSSTAHGCPTSGA